MAFCRIVVALLVLSIVQCFASVEVPVFLWGKLDRPGLKSNPLTTVSVHNFDTLLKNELQNDPFTVIFIEETLSVEDFSRKDAEGSTSFPYLHANIPNSLYLPSVESPLRVLNKIADPEKTDHVKLTENGLSAEIKPASGNFLFINLKDAKEGESRSDLLRRHNNFMEDMFTKLQERYDSVVAIYTAHYPSWTVSAHSRTRRAAEATPRTPGNYSLNGLLLQYGNLLVNGTNMTEMTSSEQQLNTSVMITTMYFPTANLTLNFYSDSGYWIFDSVELNLQDKESQHLQGQDVYALHGFSYRCGQNVSFSNENTYVAFQDLNIQPFFINNNTGLTFGEPFYCVGFFSAPIWACLFVTFILLAITFYGLMMMMDIRTMDRFDDPKGKTITINAGE